MTTLNPHLIATLRHCLPPDSLSRWTTQLQQELDHEKKQVNTPATNCTNTSWKTQGNAIDKCKRRRQHQPPSLECQPPSQQIDPSPSHKQMKNSPTVTTTKILLKQKAVFYGQECQLPYLQSSDAISQLYSKTGQDQDGEETLLFNPSPSIDRGLLTSLKSLHLYHTSVQSLRQLGTGWSNLKQLSIVYGRLGDLSGLSSFSSLEQLFLAFNQISSLSDLMFHPSIRSLDLQRNNISSIQEIEYLATIDKLQYINLDNNPVMKIKQKKRIVQQKLGKMLDNQQYSRLLDYQLSSMSKEHQMESFRDVQVSNALLWACNAVFGSDQITPQHLYDVHLTDSQEAKEDQLDFVRYETKNNQAYEPEDQIEEEEAIFTPLFHFLPHKPHHTQTLKKYIQNKLYLTIKKTDPTSQSPAHSLQMRPNSRLSKFTASTRLERGEDTQSADKMHSLTNEMHSLQKVKRTRLSLGRTKKLLQKFQKPANPGPKMISNLSSAANPLGRTVAMKRTSFMSKLSSPGDFQQQLQKRFSKTGTISFQ